MIKTESQIKQEGGLEIEKINNVFGELPEVKAGIEVWQNAFHEFDVYSHTVDFVRHLSQLTIDPNMLVAGWLHDIGKPITAKPKTDKDGVLQEREPGKPYHEFEDHEIMGRELVMKINSDLFTSLGLDQDKVAKLVECHYIPMKGIKKLRKASNFEEFKKYFNELDYNLSNLEVSKEEVLTMFLADKLAQGKFCSDREELFLIRKVLLKEDRIDKDLEEIFNIQKHG